MGGSFVSEAILHKEAKGNGAGIPLTVTGRKTVVVSVEGDYNATINFKGSFDGIRYYPIFLENMSTHDRTSQISIQDTEGIYQGNIAGLKMIKTEITNYNSGSITIMARAI